MNRLRLEWHRPEDQDRPAIALTFQYETASEAAAVLSELLEVLVGEALARLEAGESPCA